MGKGRAPCCDKTQVKKGPWSPAEDLRLIAFIQRNGHENWRSLPKQAGLARCGKSCRLRWINYLRPDVKRGNFTPEEEDTIMRLHESMGNKWARIASYIPGRTDNEIKNVWNTHLKRRVDKMEKMKRGGHESISKDVSTITSSSPTSSSTSSSCNNKSDNGKRKIDEVLVEEQSAGSTKKPNYEENNKNVTVLVPTLEDTTIATTTSSLTYESNGKTCDGVLVQNMIKKTASSEEVNKPFGVDNNMVDTPNLEADFDFWSMLDMDNLGSCNFQSNDSCNYQVVQEHVGADHEACKNLSFVVDCDKVAEQKRWLENLETELGLEATKEQQNQINIDMMMCGDHDEFLMMKPAEDDVLGDLGCSRFWPSSPHSSYII